MKKIILMVSIAMFWLPLCLSADTIYSWKDKDGIARFSNEPPPAGVTAFETIESSSEDPDPGAPENKRRTSYDQMVERASKESTVLEQERKEQAAAKATQEKEAAEAKRKAMVQAERKRLEQKINAIRNRAVSPTYPSGMKQAQIDALTKEIDNLK